MDPVMINRAEALYPGTRLWLSGRRAVPHADRPDAACYGPDGPPAEVFRAAYEPGGAFYRRHRRAERDARRGARRRRGAADAEEGGDEVGDGVFRPLVIDIRAALDASGTNVTTWEECLELGCGSAPGMPREGEGGTAGAIGSHKGA
jgi:hypothetical protein